MLMGYQILKSSQEGFPAKIYLEQGNRKALLRKEAVFGLKCLELLANLDQNTSLCRTCQHCFPGMAADGQACFSQAFPRSGMTRNGKLYMRHRSELPTQEKGFGLLLTPVRSDGLMAYLITSNMKFHVTKNGTYRKISNQGKDGNIGLLRFVKLVTGLYP